jgi:hypothetical protein
MYCVLVIRTSWKWTWFGMIITIQMSRSLSPILAINLLDIKLCCNSKTNCGHNNFKILKLFCQHILLYLMGIFPFDYYCDKNCHNNCYWIFKFMCILPISTILMDDPRICYHLDIAIWTFLLTWWNLIIC